MKPLEVCPTSGVRSNPGRFTFIDPGKSRKTSLGELIARYIREVLPIMKGAVEDKIRLTAILRKSICTIHMAHLTPKRVAQYRDERLREVAPATVIRELAYLSSIINHARREWDIAVANPVSLVRKPPSSRGRTRVLWTTEREQLLETLQPTQRLSQWIRPLVILALETAMRRGELLMLRWQDFNLVGRTANLDTTKNGDRRIVPVSSSARSLLADLPRSTK